MKTAYELAMERLQKQAPTVALTDAQKQEIAEIDSRYKARIAERELLLKDALHKARLAGKADEAAHIERQLASELQRLRDECEARKEKVRATAS